jgi:carbon monoxide dehydrogenase subunit G
MKFDHSARIPATRERVWAVIMDVPLVATCVPGVESVEALGNDVYRGTLRVKVGPIGLSLNGDVSITEKDEQAGTASMRADAADRKVGGMVKATMQMSLNPAGDGVTELRIVTDAQVGGRIGEFGQPIIKKKADQIMQEFAANVSKAAQAPA